MKYWIIHAQENPAAPCDQPGRREWRSNTVAETLADRGHDVVRWRSAFSHQAKTFLASGNVREPFDNYVQRYIACPAYHRHVGPRRIRNHAALGRNFLTSARSEDVPDLIHVGNVPIALTYAAVRYAKDVGCPVVVDIRDLWPDIYADLLPTRLSGLRGLTLRSLHLMSFRLKWALKHATSVTALTQSYLDWALDLAGRSQSDSDGIFGMCYPRQDKVPAQADLHALTARLGLTDEDLVAVYLGNIGYQSDFDTVIKAAEALATRLPQLKFVLAGSGPRQAELAQRAANMDNVVVPGWLQGPEIAALLHIADIGLVAFHPVPNYLRNIPNKFSEYLAGGLAIACGLDGEMGALVDQFECGFRYPPGDAAALTDALLNITGSPQRLHEMKTNARKLHAERFDGAEIYPKFADYLEDLATGHAVSSPKDHKAER